MMLGEGELDIKTVYDGVLGRAQPAGSGVTNLIRRVYEVDPLVCPRCGAEMSVVGFITETSVIKRILDHIRKRDRVSRPPPHLQPAVAHIG
jgi:hypothetical protein